MQNERVVDQDVNVVSSASGIGRSPGGRARRLGMAALLVVTASGAAMFVSSAATAIDDKPGQEVCGPLDSGKIDTDPDNKPLTVTVTADTGFLISGYCVKAGSDQSVDDGAVVYVTLEEPVESYTFPHPSGKTISHYSYSQTPVCEFDPNIPASSEDCREVPDPKVTESEWVDGTYECDDTTVEQTRTVTTTPYTYVDDELVLDTKRAVVTQETRTRQLSNSEIQACPTTTPPAAPPVQFQVASNTPIAPAAVASAASPQAPAIAPAATELPATGTSSWVTALIALVTLLGGTGLVRLSRRPTD